MKNLKNKSMPILIALFLTLSMGASMILVPTANAHTPAWKMPTYAYIQAMPNTVGVGQPVVIYIWLTAPFEGTLIVNDYRFHNYKLVITKPNGETQTQTWDTVTDSTSSQGYVYTPSEIGTYNLTFIFQGRTSMITAMQTTLMLTTRIFQAQQPQHLQFNKRPCLNRFPAFHSQTLTGHAQSTVKITCGSRFHQIGSAPVFHP
jgi:hypothetical protein